MKMLFQRGVVPLAILALLKREDMYGYQLVQETARSSGGKFTVREGSLYPVLYRFLDQGLISARKVQAGKRMTRIYYHLEPAGEQFLTELSREFETTTCSLFQILGRKNLQEGEPVSPATHHTAAAVASKRGGME